MKKFYKHYHVEGLIYLARALSAAGRLREAKIALSRARRVAPHDGALLYNTALILRRLATHVLRDDRSPLPTVLGAVHELGLSQKYFTYLSTSDGGGDRVRYDTQLAALEARQCQDLLFQADHHVGRARRADEEEKSLRRKQEMEKEAFKKKQVNIGVM